MQYRRFPNQCRICHSTFVTSSSTFEFNSSSVLVSANVTENISPNISISFIITLSFGNTSFTMFSISFLSNVFPTYTSSSTFLLYIISAFRPTLAITTIPAIMIHIKIAYIIFFHFTYPSFLATIFFILFKNNTLVMLILYIAIINTAPEYYCSKTICRIPCSKALILYLLLKLVLRLMPLISIALLYAILYCAKSFSVCFSVCNKYTNKI